MANMLPSNVKMQTSLTKTICRNKRRTQSSLCDACWQNIFEYLSLVEELMARRAFKCCTTDFSNFPTHGQVRACYIWYVDHNKVVQDRECENDNNNRGPGVNHKCNIEFCHSTEVIRYNAWKYFYGYMKNWQDRQLCQGLLQLQRGDNVHRDRELMVGPYAEGHVRRIGFIRKSLCKRTYDTEKIKWLPSIDVTQLVRRVKCGRQMTRYWQSLVITYVKEGQMLQILEAALEGELHVQGLEHKPSTDHEESGSYHFSWAKQHELHVEGEVCSPSQWLECEEDDDTSLYTFRKYLVSN